MRQVQPLPINLPLAPTLAQRVSQLREFRNLTVRDLSELSRFPHKRIEEIEAGFESWLSATDRQLLSKALSVEPGLLEEVEVRTVTSDSFELYAAEKRLAANILEGARGLPCPYCGKAVRASVQEGFDIKGLPVRLAKAFCTKCPFVLR